MIFGALCALLAPAIARAQFGAGLPSGPIESPFVYGPLILAPGIDYDFGYHEGTLYAPGHSSSYYEQSVAPRLAGTYGSVWSFSYDSSLDYYSTARFHDTFDQRGELAAAWVTDDWSLRADQLASITNLPTLETGRQTRETEYVTTLSGARQVGSDLTFKTAETQSIESAGVLFPHSQVWATDDSLLYSVTGTVSVGPGVTVSYMKLLGVIQMLQTAPTMRLNWQINEISSLTAFAGFSNQTFLTGHFHDTNEPSVGASLNFISQFGTTISGTASDVAGFSVLTAQRTQIQQVQTQIHQVVLTHGFLDISGTVGRDSYDVATDLRAVNRTDNVYGFNLSAGIDGLFKHGRIAAMYSYNHNSSTIGDFSQTPRMIGFNVEYRY
jgi:hypothetical protein